MAFSRRAFAKSGLAVIGAASIPALRAASAQSPLTPPTNGVAANPLEAIDGEKIRAVVNGERVVIRLISCDAPEPEVGENTTECGFLDSRWALNQAITDKTLLLESDEEDIDNKDRLWRHVWLINADGSDGGLLNQQLLQQGWCTTQEEEKNTKHAEEYAAAAKDAQTNKAGLVATCSSFHEEINRHGGHDEPALIGEYIQAKGVQAVLNSYYYSYVDALGSAAPGGYKYLIVNVTIMNLRETGKYSYSGGSFAGKDMDTAADYDDEFAFLNTALNSGELSPGEYATGEVAIEVQETATNVRTKFSIESDYALYWMTPA